MVLRQDVSVWHVEAVNRAAAVVGENGEPADQYSIVRWGTDRYGLLLGEHSMHQGEEEISAALVGLVDAVPLLIGTFTRSVMSRVMQRVWTKRSPSKRTLELIRTSRLDDHRLDIDLSPLRGLP